MARWVDYACESRGMAYGRHIYKVSNDAATMLYKIRSDHKCYSPSIFIATCLLLLTPFAFAPRTLRVPCGPRSQRRLGLELALDRLGHALGKVLHGHGSAPI
jgi:hypothetical protein